MRGAGQRCHRNCREQLRERKGSEKAVNGRLRDGDEKAYAVKGQRSKCMRRAGAGSRCGEGHEIEDFKVCSIETVGSLRAGGIMAC